MKNIKIVSLLVLGSGFASCSMDEEYIQDDIDQADLTQYGLFTQSDLAKEQRFSLGGDLNLLIEAIRKSDNHKFLDSTGVLNSIDHKEIRYTDCSIEYYFPNTQDYATPTIAGAFEILECQSPARIQKVIAHNAQRAEDKLSPYNEMIAIDDNPITKHNYGFSNFTNSGFKLGEVFSIEGDKDRITQYDSICSIQDIHYFKSGTWSYNGDSQSKQGILLSATLCSENAYLDQLKSPITGEAYYLDLDVSKGHW